jgi:hypothetical protein
MAPLGLNKGGGSAKAMLHALRFPHLAERVLQTLHEVLGGSAGGRGSASLPGAVVTFAITSDAASNNRLLFNHLVWYYLRHRQLQVPEVLLCLVHCLCVAHQVHICSCTMFGIVGGESRVESKRFITQLCGANRILAQATYVTRFLAGAALHLEKEALFLTPEEAAPRSSYLLSIVYRSSLVSVPPPSSSSSNT